jgi:hypothetical protein
LSPTAEAYFETVDSRNALGLLSSTDSDLEIAVIQTRGRLSDLDLGRHCEMKTCNLLVSDGTHRAGASP